MAISIILPSKNEAKNIEIVTQVADIALQMYFPQYKSFLLNVDSASEDGTSEVFLSTDTTTPKIGIILDKEKSGKGYNLKTGIEYSIGQEVDYFVTLDTDVRSIKPIWIKNYLEQLIQNKADFVTPVYKRNRYEGNTTNHFSSPLLYACWNKDIQQPIAGDFSFSRKQAISILNSYDAMEDYKYGVDSMMTWCALTNDYTLTQINLDSKIHNPSFSKLPEMFKQVCFSTFYRVNKFREQIKENLCNDIAKIEDIEIEDEYISVPNAVAVESLGIKAEGLLKRIDPGLAREDVDSDVWMNCLAESVESLLHQPASKAKIYNLVEKVSPFYYARVANYIMQAQNMNSDDISTHLKEQKLSLALKLRAKFG